MPLGTDRTEGLAEWILGQESSRSPSERGGETKTNPSALSIVATECPPLDDLLSVLMRYVVWPDWWSPIVVTLWAAHTHLMSFFDTTPRLGLLSALPESGKTRVLDIIKPVVKGGLMTADASVSSIFRRIAAEPTTLLMDEVDAIWANGGDEQLRAVLNAGYKRGAVLTRSERSTRSAPWSPKEFGLFAPVALAGLHRLPPTLLSRSIVIRMKRRRGDEPIGAFRAREVGPTLEQIAKDLETWAGGASSRLTVPNLPEGLTDRPAEIWEPIIQIADLAGPSWAAAVRAAALSAYKGACATGVTAVTASGGDDDVLVLRAVQSVFKIARVDRMTTEDLLLELENQQIPGLSKLDGSGLAKALQPFEVGSRQFRISGQANPKRGYLLADLEDAFCRYLA